MELKLILLGNPVQGDQLKACLKMLEHPINVG
jgi:hypothetical protein